MKFTRAFTFLFIAIAFSVQAQSTLLDGYIITNKSDTIYGKIDLGQSTNLYTECNFIQDGKNKKYLPTEIFAYGIKDAQYYSSQKIKGQFVEVLLESQLSLYRLKNDFYIKKGLDSLVTLSKDNQSESSNGTKEKKRNWKGILSYYTLDCKKISSKANALNFNEKELVQFVKSYNECIGSSFKEMKSNIPSMKVNLGFNLATSFTSLTLNNSDLPTRTKNVEYSIINPMVGLYAEFSFPRTANKLIFVTELNVSKLNYDRSVIDEYSSFEILTENKGSHIELSLPLIAKYLVYRGKVNTYLHIGLNTVLLLDKNYATTTTEIISPQLQYVKKDTNPLFGEEYGIGFVAGINIQKMIGKSSIGFFARTGINSLLATKKVDINSEEYVTTLGFKYTL
jgi:hypothetical protein